MKFSMAVYSWSFIDRIYLVLSVVLDVIFIRAPLFSGMSLNYISSYLVQP